MRPPGERAGAHHLLPVGSALFQELRQHALATVAGEQVAGLFLEERVFDAVGVDLGKTPGERGAIHLLEPEAEVAQDRDGLLRVGVRVAAAAHPERAGAEEEPGVPGPLVLSPQRERPLHHLGVDAVGAVGGADDPGFSPGAGARVPRTPGVEQRHLGAQPEQVQGVPAPNAPAPITATRIPRPVCPSPPRRAPPTNHRALRPLRRKSPPAGRSEPNSSVPDGTEPAGRRPLECRSDVRYSIWTSE